MKSTVFVLAVVLAAVVAGCQDTSDIIGAPAAGSASLTKPAPVSSRQVAFSATTRDPGAVLNSFIRVEGEVSYTMTILRRDPAPPSPQHVAVINLVVDATLTELWGGEQGGVFESSYQEIPLSSATDDMTNADDEGSWKSTYAVRGFGGRLVLDLTYRVTQKGVEIVNISLKSVKRGS